jgi:hypothetical protein
MLVSIYGENLGPAKGCEGQADTRRRQTPSPARPWQAFANTLIYPTELCGVQVLVGDLAAGLLYVQDKQINFQVPQEVALEGTAALNVVYQGQSNSPVSVAVGLGKVSLLVEGSARVGGPVWIRVDLPYGWGEVRYPVRIVPADFGCNEMEVRQNGVLLPRLSRRPIPIMRNGPPCGGISMPGTPRHSGRLPLHLQYRFEKPGIYEVRYRLKKSDFGPVPAEMALESEWTRFEVLPARSLPVQPAPADPVESLSDYLPSILGFPDAASLQIVVKYLYDRNNLVRRYTEAGLAYWPQQEVDTQVVALIRGKGPTDVLVNLLRSPKVDVTESMLPYLASDDPMLLGGAILGVSRALSDPQQPLQPEARLRAESALLGAADHVVRTGNAEMLNSFAVTLGSVHNERAREILWNFVERNVAAEQSLIAISWHKDPRDLPRLGALLVAPVVGDSRSYELTSIPYALRNSYGEAAVPFLESAIKDSRYVFVRTNCARELVIAGRPAGFAFIADAIERNRFYKPEMVEFVRGRFPELKGADEGAVLGFIKRR